MNFLKIKITSILILILTLIQCQAKSPTVAQSANTENYTELKELLKNSNKSGNNISFVAAAALSTPCVVHIRNKSTVVVNTISPFHDFFGNEFFMQQPRNQKQESTGSGVIISSDGYIVTNNHVIQNATEIEVTLRNKNTYKAKVIGVDKDSDLALIKIEESDLPSIQIANSDSVMVGEWVLAVGNPFNLESTVTQGIVSAKGRSLNMGNGQRGVSPIESFIQTDAAVNPGNSGGALVNLNGELVGINTAIASPTGAYAGYAFAVPSNIVRKVVEDLKTFGNVQRAFLGIEPKALTSDKAKQLKLQSPKGVLIKSTTQNGAANMGGLQAGDVIVQVDKYSIGSFPELLEHLSTYRPGDKVSIEYYRNGNLNKTQVVLKNKNNSTELIKKDDNIYQRIGLEVSPLSNREKSSYGIPHGVKVTRITPGTLSQSTDMKVGFVILNVDETPMTSQEDLISYFQSKQSGRYIFEGFYPGRPYTYQYAIKL